MHDEVAVVVVVAFFWLSSSAKLDFGWSLARDEYYQLQFYEYEYK